MFHFILYFNIEKVYILHIYSPRDLYEFQVTFENILIKHTLPAHTSM